jgi:hypothetical protein
MALALLGNASGHASRSAFSYVRHVRGRAPPTIVPGFIEPAFHVALVGGSPGFVACFFLRPVVLL